METIFNPDISVELECGWCLNIMGDFKIYVSGVCERINDISNVLSNDSSVYLECISKILKEERGCFGVIVVGPGFFFAAVDRIRSSPIYYLIDGGCVSAISNSARVIQHSHSLSEKDDSATLEFMMSGYVSGNQTLYKGLYQLQAGECIFGAREQGGSNYSLCRYYRYIPKPQNEFDEEAGVERLGAVLDRSIQRAIQRAGRDPIWVPLSGGLDSRLILAKLVEHGYPSLQSFSYGIKNNQEVQVARDVAKKLGVDWVHFPSRPKRARQLYTSAARREYDRFADGLCTMPKYLDFEVFHYLTSKKIIPNDAIIINGQSGDFITGGHVPQSLNASEATERDLLEAVIDKHYSLWPKVNTDINKEKVYVKILSLLSSVDGTLSERDRLCAQYESWEWQERQCKAVVNAQKIYEFFNLRWLLPLWDGELMDFYETVPYSLKSRQLLYQAYLRKYNFKGVFDTLRFPSSSWPPHRQWIPWCARAIGLFFGVGQKEKFYKRMSYYNNYENQYALFGRKYYLKNYDDARGVTSFAVDHWLMENNFPRPSELHRVCGDDGR